jgi:Tfp pilus assembly protein PilX
MSIRRRLVAEDGSTMREISGDSGRPGSRDPDRAPPGTLGVRRLIAPCRRLLREEEGMALVMALLIILVLTITLTAVIFLTAAGARDARRSNAGQQAYALAESGLNNGLAVLNANYPGTTVYPGNANLLLTTTLTSAVTLPAATINVASTTGYNPGTNAISVGSSGAVTCTGITATTFTGCTGGVAGTYGTGTNVARATASGVNSVTWSGSLVNVPANPSWKWQWNLTATGRVKNPTGPTAGDVVRTSTAVVPVTIPDSTSVNPALTSIDWVYASTDVSFGQSMNVASPVYAVRDLNLTQTATIAETIPATLTQPATPNRVYAGRYLSLSGPQNQVGHVNGSVDPANDLGEIHAGGIGDPQGYNCKSKNNPSPHSCVWGATDKIWGVVHDNVFPLAGFIAPTLTCCSPVSWAAPADGTSHPANPSYMGFWYQNAGLGPNSGCATFSGTPPTFDTGDSTINQSAYPQATPFDLTGAPYSCTSADGNTKLAWDGTTLTIKGTVFIDGSAQSSSNGAKYVGKGTIILSGTFSMSNHNALCVNLSAGNCNTSVQWDADTTALAIVADGLDGSGNSVNIKQGQFQGLLIGNGNVYGDPASGTLIVGPMVSVYGSVSVGQSGTLQFPPISFASSGTDGLTGPLPLPQLLSPVQFGGG